MEVMKMLTTAALPEFLEEAESSNKPRLKAYDDLQPHLDLNAGDEDKVMGKVTIGDGTTVYPNGMPVKLGDTITLQQSRDFVKAYIRQTVEPALANMFPPHLIKLKPHQYDAIGSLIYNFGAGAVAQWRLPGRISRKEPWDAIALEWLDGTSTSKGIPLLGLYRRRIAEVLMFFGLDWRAGFNATWETSVVEVVKTMGEPAPTTKRYEDMSDAEKVAFLNDQQNILLGGDPSTPEPDPPKAASIPRQKNVVAVPVLQTTESKLIEDSTTGRGYAKETAGRENMVVGGTLAVIGSAIPTIEKTTGYFEDFSTGAIIRTILVVGFIIVGIGLWRWHRGRIIKHEGRLTATQPKV